MRHVSSESPRIHSFWLMHFVLRIDWLKFIQLKTHLMASFDVFTNYKWRTLIHLFHFKVSTTCYLKFATTTCRICCYYLYNECHILGIYQTTPDLKRLAGVDVAVQWIYFKVLCNQNRIVETIDFIEPRLSVSPGMVYCHCSPGGGGG